jgi:hypothetical protein
LHGKEGHDDALVQTTRLPGGPEKRRSCGRAAASLAAAGTWSLSVRSRTSYILGIDVIGYVVEQRWKMAVVAVAGMPGSGKSRVMEQYARNGYARFDDININWAANIAAVIQLVQQGKDVIVSDIEFCRASKRQDLEKAVSIPVQWIFFENDPLQCAKNVLYRFFVERENRPWGEEIHKIQQYSKEYLPAGDVRPVIKMQPLP